MEAAQHFEVYNETCKRYGHRGIGYGIVTVIAIVGGLLILALIWREGRRRHHEDGYHGERYAEKIGKLEAMTKCNTKEIEELECYERKDFGQLEYMRGRESCEDYGYERGRRGRRDECDCDRDHHRHGNRNEFIENRKFKEESDEVSVITRCIC